MASSSEIFTVFYSWQSDTPKNHGRHLVKEALDNAADALSSDPEVGYRVNIDQDTQNETGLCDIPAVILNKIASADAVVADLTFVAQVKAADDNGKLCSNPNVLFELGYAFNAIGPERLICVMNEAHGPRAAQIFDLHHRRHPIAFTSPNDGTTREDNVQKLTKMLIEALRPILLKGPRSITGDSTDKHEDERSQIQSFHDAHQGANQNEAVLVAHIHPEAYRDRRWKNSEELESLMLQRGIWNSRREFPPRRMGTATMPWGLYNNRYRENWALTYAGQFWFQEVISHTRGHDELVVQYEHVTGEPVDATPKDAISCIYYLSVIEKIYWLFCFMSALSKDFHDSERLTLEVGAKSLTGKYLVFDASGYYLSDDPMGPCVAPWCSRRFQMTASELRNQHEEIAITCMQELCDMFPTDGRRITRETLKSWIDKFAGREVSRR